MSFACFTSFNNTLLRSEQNPLSWRGPGRLSVIQPLPTPLVHSTPPAGTFLSSEHTTLAAPWEIWPEFPLARNSILKALLPTFQSKLASALASLSHPPFIFPKLLLLSEIILHECLTQLLTICHQNASPWRRETRLSCSLTSLSCKQKALNNYFLEEWRTARQNAHLKG